MGGVQSIARSKLLEREDGSIRSRHLPWLLKHLDDIEKESNKQYNEEEWREKILNLRRPNIAILVPTKRRSTPGDHMILCLPAPSAYTANFVMLLHRER